MMIMMVTMMVYSWQGGYRSKQVILHARLSYLREFGLAHYRHQSRGPARGRKLGPEPAQNDLTHLILLWCFVFQHLIWDTPACTRFFTKTLKRRAPAAAARLVFVEIVASETPEH